MKLIFTPEFIQQVKEANDIVEVASDYFALKESSGIYKAHCKHRGGDKTPSLTFFPDTQSFYCFGCHVGQKGEKTEGSDVISFIQWIEDLHWQDAVIFLANRAGITIPQAQLSADDKMKQNMYAECLVYNRRYWGNLNNQNFKHVKEFFYSRGITDADIAKWRLGVSQFTSRDTGVPTYAIMDEQGRTVSFAYRVDNEYGKYINGKTSPIFKKGNILYGLNYIKKEARHHKFMIIVEGFHDVIAMQRVGAPTVATMGTAVTEEHAKLIKKYVDNVIIFMDGDTAGIDSTIESIRLLKKHGLEVEVINILGFDPDEVALKYKEGTLDFILKNKKLAFQFLVNNVLDKYFDNMIRLKKETIKKLEEVLEYIDDPVERQVYHDQLLKVISLEEKKSEV